jgi:hypothetical protein
MADHQALQAPYLRVQGGQFVELALDVFSVREGVEQQALVLVDRNDQIPATTFLQALAVAGGHHQPAFHIER